MKTAEALAVKLEALGKLHDIVRNMKALSSANLNQYEQAVHALQDYYRTVELGLHVVLHHLPEQPPQARPRSKTPRLAAIVFGSDYGLCGRFNQNLCEYALQRMDTMNVPAESRQILAVGSKTLSSLEEYGASVHASLLTPATAEQITDTVATILLKLDAWKIMQEADHIWLFYNRRSSKVHYQQTALPLLPMDRVRIGRIKEIPWPSNVVPTFSMEAEALRSKLLHQYLFVALFRACAESLASEHNARLTAMQQAEKSIGETLEETMTEYRRVRQELITAEILEVLTGFEASENERR